MLPDQPEPLLPKPIVPGPVSPADAPLQLNTDKFQNSWGEVLRLPNLKPRGTRRDKANFSQAFEAELRSGPPLVIVPGPGGVPIRLSPKDFLRNLEILSTSNNSRNQPNEWRAIIPHYGQKWEIIFRGHNKASVRVFTESELKSYEALRAITEAAERDFSSRDVDPITGSRFSVRVIKIPNSTEQIVMARDVSAIPFVRGLIERLFESELGLAEPCLEQFEFKVPKLQLFHQHESRTVDVLVSYRYKRAAEYPDFLRLDDVVKDFFKKYSASDDYWEKVNKNLVRTLLHQYPMLDRIAVMVVAHPDKHVKTFRASTVMMDRQQLALEEAA